MGAVETHYCTTMPWDHIMKKLPEITMIWDHIGSKITEDATMTSHISATTIYVMWSK
jgi:hypothetical protein